MSSLSVQLRAVLSGLKTPSIRDTIRGGPLEQAVTDAYGLEYEHKRRLINITAGAVWRFPFTRPLHLYRDLIPSVLRATHHRPSGADETSASARKPQAGSPGAPAPASRELSSERGSPWQVPAEPWGLPEVLPVQRVPVGVSAPGADVRPEPQRNSAALEQLPDDWEQDGERMHPVSHAGRRWTGSQQPHWSKNRT
jgi:hypothetical protein